MNRSLGIVGLGLLGSAVAERALRSGFQVTGYDVDAACRRRLRRLGGRDAGSSAEVAETCRRLLFVLPHDGIVREVVAQLGPALERGHVIFDATTGDPESTVEMGERLAARGVAYLDTTVLGSSAEVRAGGGVVLVGGPEGLARAHRAVLGCLGSRMFHLGPCGAGARMKLVANLVMGLNRAALAEGLVFARAIGVDPGAALEVLRSGAAYSRAMDTKGPKMVRGEFAPAARLSQHLKDVRLILRAARRAGLRLPLEERNRRLLERVEAMEKGGLDNSAVILAYGGRR